MGTLSSFNIRIRLVKTSQGKKTNRTISLMHIGVKVLKKIRKSNLRIYKKDYTPGPSGNVRLV